MKKKRFIIGQVTEKTLEYQSLRFLTLKKTLTLILCSVFETIWEVDGCTKQVVWEYTAHETKEIKKIITKKNETNNK